MMLSIDGSEEQSKDNITRPSSYHSQLREYIQSNQFRISTNFP